MSHFTFNFYSGNIDLDYFNILEERVSQIDLTKVVVWCIVGGGLPYIKVTGVIVIPFHHMSIFS